MKSLSKFLFATALALGLLSNAVYAEAQHSVEPNKTVKEVNAEKAESSEPVNINAADVKTLATLKGIGDKKAMAIVAYRKEHGQFNSVEALADVKGIGKNRLARIQAQNPGRLTLK